ncbi:MAG: lssD [Gammaproteobacteria bacterium]|jgi:adhesin transport system membrane fusion protein|nr:lssD [Gammaproteobacteria bacterium]
MKFIPILSACLRVIEKVKDKILDPALRIKVKNKVSDAILKLVAYLEEKTDPANRFMADTHPRHTQGANVAAHAILWTTVVFLVVAFIWAKYSIIDEVTTGEGKVIPASQIQIIQNLEGGIVEKIFVREGQIVQKNQVLIQLNDVQFGASYEATKLKAYALEVKIARLLAVIENKPFLVSEVIQKGAPSLVAHEKALYLSQEREQKHLEEAYQSNKKEYELTKPLVKKGAASEVEVLRLERQVSAAQEQIDSFQSDVLQDLNTAKADLLGVNASLEDYKDRLSRTTIRSPVKGIVNKINITTIGGVSQPGMDLIEIVPLEDTLLVEAKIKPKDIGFLTVGQSATVKISAYDYSIYGGLEGRVEKISADSVQDEERKNFYIVDVRTKKNYLGTKAKPLYIIPGMVATVDVLTGRKSVLSYLMKPIMKAKEKALHER